MDFTQFIKGFSSMKQHILVKLYINYINKLYE